MYIRIDLSDNAKQAILNDEEWEGSCKIKLIKRKIRNSKKESRVPTEIESLIIDYWNDNDIRKSLEGERNIEVNVDDVVLILRKCLNKYDAQIILDKLDMYFDACVRGKHIYSDRDVSYKDLSGFCNAILKNNKEKWYEKCAIIENDDNPNGTKFVANEYAKEFLNRKEYALRKGNVEYGKFKLAFEYVSKTAIAMKKSENEILKDLFKCLRQTYNDIDIIPGHLSSDRTWKLLMPKYYKNKLDL